MADISTLGQLQPSEPLDFDIYKDAQDLPPLPSAGEYVVRAPETFPQEAFGKTRANHLSVQVDPTIIGPTNEGYVIRFTKVSAKPFKRGGVTVSQLGDYLRAVGWTQKLITEQEKADAVELTTNLTYRVMTDWRAYDKNDDGTAFVVEGMTNFPSDGNGGYSPFVSNPGHKDLITGEPVLVRANLVVRRYVPAAAQV